MYDTKASCASFSSLPSAISIIWSLDLTPRVINDNVLFALTFLPLNSTKISELNVEAFFANKEAVLA